MDIKKRANELAGKFQTRNPFEIIQGLNVILVFAPLIDTRAFYQYFQRNNIIYIDENLLYREKIFECAHEMGHMFLHKKANAIFMDTRTGIFIFFRGVFFLVLFLGHFHANLHSRQNGVNSFWAGRLPVEHLLATGKLADTHQRPINFKK